MLEAPVFSPLEVMARVMFDSWGSDTCHPARASIWSSENPALGQCAGSSLVYHDYFGGVFPFCSHVNHYWNLLPESVWDELQIESWNGLPPREVDITRSQFPRGEALCVDEILTREQLLEKERPYNVFERYKLLKRRVERKIYAECLASYG